MLSPHTSTKYQGYSTSYEDDPDTYDNPEDTEIKDMRAANSASLKDIDYISRLSQLQIEKSLEDNANLNIKATAKAIEKQESKFKRRESNKVRKAAGVYANYLCCQESSIADNLSQK